jgi:hypothetical protein
MQIEVVPNTTRDAILDPAITAAGPNYFQITNGLENGFTTDGAPLNALSQVETTAPGQQIKAALCQSDTPITVADITVAAFDGGGYFSAALGGVNASTSPLPTNSFNLATGGFGTLTTPTVTQVIPGTLGTSGTTGSPPTLGNTGAGPTGVTSLTPTSSGSTPTPTPTPTPAVVPQSIESSPAGFASGGPLLAPGLAGLGLLLLLLEADRRMMRRAQRQFATIGE